MMNEHGTIMNMQRTFIVALAFCGWCAVNAQGTPPAQENVSQAPSQPTTTAPLAPQLGWMWWDDANGRDMNIAVIRMKELQDIDSRYRTEYDALGNTPWTNPGYEALSRRRDAEVKPLLTPEQYQEYSRRNTRYKLMLAAPDTIPPTPRRP